MSEREQVWRELIEWQPWSGLTVAECCEEAGVSVASFYRWKKLLTEPQGSRQLRYARMRNGFAPWISSRSASNSKWEAISSFFMEFHFRFWKQGLRVSRSWLPSDSSADAAENEDRTALMAPLAKQSIASDHGSSMRIELPNGMVIHVAGDLDGQRLGDVIIAAGQIHRVHAGATAHGLLQHEVPSC